MKIILTTKEVTLLTRVLETAAEEGETAEYKEALTRLQQKLLDATEGAPERKKELRHAASLLSRLSSEAKQSYDKKVLAEAAEHLDAAADVEGAC